MKRETFVAELRRFADLIESRPEVPVPYSGICMTGFLDGPNEEQRATLALLAKEFAPVEKVYSDWHAGIKLIQNDILTFAVYARRESVCTRKVETKVVPEKRIPATEEVVIPEHEETVETWDCSSSLLEDQAVGA